MRGAFITFEGIDGSGKSSQLKTLYEDLKREGRNIITTYEPGGTPLANELRTVFKDPKWKGMGVRTELLILNAGRSDLTENIIIPQLNSGGDVLADRFVDSTRAYQGFGRGYPSHLINRMHEEVIGIEADLTILTTAPVELCMERSRKRNGEAADRLDDEGRAFFKRVHDGYLALAQQYPDRFRVFDTSGDCDDVQQAIRSTIDAFLRERNYQPSTQPLRVRT